MSTSNQMATNNIPNQPTHWGEKRRYFFAHPLWARLWAALAFALLLATTTNPSAGAASLDRPVDAAQRQALPVGEPYLVKDVNAAAPRQLNPKGLIKIDGILYFNGDLWPSGEGLWRSDGTSEGTILLKRNENR